MTAGIAAAIMFRIHATITTVAVLPLLITFITGRYTTRWVVRYWRSKRETPGAVTGFLGKVFSSVLSIKIADAETDVVAHLSTLSADRSIADLRHSLFLRVLDGLWHNLGDLGLAPVLLLSARSIQAGTFTVGDFALFSGYIWLVVSGPSVAGAFMADYLSQAVSIQRMTALCPDGPPESLVETGPAYLTGSVPDVPQLHKTEHCRLGTIHAHNLAYEYSGSGRVIEGINLRLPRGSFTVITGRGGSGKTMLLRLLLGLLPRDAGQIRWNGEPVGDPATFFTPPRNAYTAQVPSLFSESVRDNILMGLREESVDLEDAVRSAVMQRGLAELPAGLGTVIRVKGIRLSGGQR